MLHLILPIFTLFLCWVIGYGASLIIALPPTLLGILILFISLAIMGRVPDSLQNLCQFLLRHLSLFFIAPIVAAWVYIEALQQQAWLFLIAIVISTALSLLITAWLAQRLITETDKPFDEVSDDDV